MVPAPGLDAVRSNAATMGRGVSGESVRQVQGHLAEAGHSVPQDGVFGPSTERGVGAFQADRGLPATGRVDSSTLQALEHGALAERSGGTDPTAVRTMAAAASVYAAHGDEPYTLSDRATVRDLIARTPQLDDLSATTGDRTRCGGAALMNGLLLDGDPAANGLAIRRTLGDHVRPGAEADALHAMERGTLTPRQLSTLQDMMYRETDARVPDAAGPETGVTATEMTGMMESLVRNGGYSHTTDLRLGEEVSGPNGECHWTVDSTTSAGTVHADSWPGADGTASTSSGAHSAHYEEGDNVPANFAGEARMTHDADGVTIRRAIYDEERGAIGLSQDCYAPGAPVSSSVSFYSPTGELLDPADFE